MYITAVFPAACNYIYCPRDFLLSSVEADVLRSWSYQNRSLRRPRRAARWCISARPHTCPADPPPCPWWGHLVPGRCRTSNSSSDFKGKNFFLWKSLKRCSDVFSPNSLTWSQRPRRRAGCRCSGSGWSPTASWCGCSSAVWPWCGSPPGLRHSKCPAGGRRRPGRRRVGSRHLPRN